MNTNPVYIERLEESANGCSRMFWGAPSLSASEFLRRSKQEEWSIVDARSQRERRVSIIAGSLSIEEFEAQIEEHKNKHILVYCTIGCRSGAYAQKLRAKGLEAFNLWGGVLAWTQDDRTFATPDGQPTRRLHVHGGQWAVLPPSYEAVW